MNKYAMVTINHKLDENDNLLVRRVLISYTGKEPDKDREEVINYTGTKFIFRDGYFFDKSKSHQYTFHDDGYVLMDVTNELKDMEQSMGLINSKRPYHYFINIHDSLGWPTYADPIEFEAESNDEAVERFTEREEMR